MKRRFICLCCFVLSLTGCAAAQPQPPGSLAAPSSDQAPLPATEMRGVWVTYLELDRLLSDKTAQQAAQAIENMMSRIAAFGLNTVFFHVRANSDAYYVSDRFPPAASAAALLAEGFDPLDCAVKAAHRRGLALHAWVNPYRVGRRAENSRCEEMFERDGVSYYVPSAPAVQGLILSGIRELTSRYDIDGIQFDDYFYPADDISNTQPEAFEQDAFAAYAQQGGRHAISVWRTEQVNSLIASVCRLVHTKPGLVFGISPSLDIEKNASSHYADLVQWSTRTGYVDYICPQLYVGFEHETAPFEQTLARWESVSRADTVSLYIGLPVYKIGLSPDRYAGTGTAEWGNHGDILARMIRRLRTGEAGGFCLYSYSYLDPGRSRPNGQSYRADYAETELQSLKELLQQ